MSQMLHHFVLQVLVMVIDALIESQWTIPIKSIWTRHGDLPAVKRAYTRGHDFKRVVGLKV